MFNRPIGNAALLQAKVAASAPPGYTAALWPASIPTISRPALTVNCRCFPLNNVVLFPGMPLPLHIFEERYKAMIGACIDRDEPFGVLLIKEGSEVGAPASPHSVGTTARVTQAQRLEGGRLNILTRGESRFELLETVQTTPHLVGLVRYIADDEGEVSQTTLAGVREEYIALQRQLTAMSGGWDREVRVPDAPIGLARIAAAALAVSLPLPPDVRQDLLETPTAGGQLEKLLTPDAPGQPHRGRTDGAEHAVPGAAPQLVAGRG